MIGSAKGIDMGKTTDIQELRSRARDLAMIAEHKDRILWFWKQQESSNEMMEIINRVDRLLERIRVSRLPQDSVDVTKAGQQIQSCAQRAVEITKDGTPMNGMMKMFIEALRYDDVQGGEPKDGEDDRGV